MDLKWLNSNHCDYCGEQYTKLYTFNQLDGDDFCANCGRVFYTLRDYQKDGVAFLNLRQRAWITDAPGIGKTPQTAYAAEGKVLVCVPNYLTEGWYEWLTGTDAKSLERNYGQVIPNVTGKVAIAKGNRTARTEALTSGARWTIINVEMLRTYQDELKELASSYETVIFDEAHHLKNRNAKQAKFAVELSKVIPRVYMATATPIWREADDLFMQLRVLWPDVYTSYWKFVDTWCTAETDRFGTKVTGVKKGMQKDLEAMLQVVRIGRSYEEAGRSLPPVIEKYVKIELPPEVRQMYNQAINEFRIEILETKFPNYMKMFHALRRIITGAFKTQAVANLLDDQVRKAVIFSWYQETAEAIAYDAGLDMELVTGAQDVTERRRRALADKHVSATIASLSEGIDLSDARVVIFAEENWTPGSNYQAKSRVVRERVGSARSNEPVLLYYVHCKNTIDEVIHRRSKMREGTIKELLHEAVFM